MPDRGHRLAGALTERVDVQRNRSPAHDAHPERPDGLLDDGSRPIVPVEERNDRVRAAEQSRRDLDQQARPVAALAVRVEPAAMGEPGKRPHPEGHRLMTQPGRGNKTHAAGGTARGEVPRPCEARTRQSWGHWAEGYRPSPGPG